MGMMDHQNALTPLFATLLALRRNEHAQQAAGEPAGQFVKASILGAAVLTSSEVYLRADGSLSDFPSVDALTHGPPPARPGLSAP